MITDQQLLVAEDGAFQVWLRKGIPQEIIDFLKTARYGTEGAIYEHLGTEDRVAHMHQTLLAYATKGEDLVACMVMNQVEARYLDQTIESYYIRYFNAHPKYRGQGITKRMSLLFIEQLRNHVPGKALFYAALEVENKRSTSIVEKVGFQKIAKVNTIGFSRFFPKKSTRIEVLTDEEERKQMLNQLASFYEDYTFVHFLNIFQKDHYYVIRQQGKIVAGIQMHKTVWRIKNMPGTTGWLLLNIVPRLPLFNKMINPKHFEFLSFEGIYFAPGHEAALIELMEGLLAKENLKTAIFWLAATSHIYQMLIKKVKLGIMHSFVKDAATYIAADMQYLEEEEKQKIINSTPYISTFDFI